MLSQRAFLRSPPYHIGGTWDCALVSLGVDHLLVGRQEVAEEQRLKAEHGESWRQHRVLSAMVAGASANDRNGPPEALSWLP